jgi:hypothetical protein
LEDLYIKDYTKARDLAMEEHVFRLRWKYDELSPSMFVGQIDLALYEDCRGLDDLWPIAMKSGCPSAIYEQILKHGNPDYIFNIADSGVDRELKYQGFGEQLYLKSFEALAEKLDASILFIADTCALSSTSEDAEKLWKKLARMQDAEHHFAWFQPKPEKDRDNPAEDCAIASADLKEEFDESLMHYHRRLLSQGVGDAVDAYLKRSRPPKNLVKDKVKRYGLEGTIPYDVDLWTFGSALMERIEFFTDSIEDLNNIARLMLEDSLFWHFVPPYFGYSEIKEVKGPFWFVHFTDSNVGSQILQEGFKGRPDTELLYSTKKGVQVEPELNSGYIFGYLLSASVTSCEEAVEEVDDVLDAFGRQLEEAYADGDDDEVERIEAQNPYKASTENYVLGQATFGIDAYHKMDRERQLIIPVTCILPDTLCSYDEAFGTFTRS